MSLLKDLDDPKSSKYTFSDFWSDFSWDSLQNKVDQAQKEIILPYLSGFIFRTIILDQICN